SSRAIPDCKLERITYPRVHVRPPEQEQSLARQDTVNLTPGSPQQWTWLYNFAVFCPTYVGCRKMGTFHVSPSLVPPSYVHLCELTSEPSFVLRDHQPYSDPSPERLSSSKG